MKTALQFKDGDGGGEGPFDPRDVAIHILEGQVEELRSVMRRLLETDGQEATAVIAEAQKLLDALDDVDREVEDEHARETNFNATHCDCGAHKGRGTSYCPVCDAEALARMADAPDWSNVVAITSAPF